VTEPHDWPAEQSARGTLRPWHYTTVGYLAAVFEDPEEALRAQRGLRDQGVPEADLRLYVAEEILGIASRLQQERSIVARAGGSQLWVHAPTKDRADRLVALLADYHYLSLHYFGEDSVETVEGNVRSTSTGQRDDRRDRDDHSD
jgi:hypothetical protein